jgi:hypothetical protein
MLYALLFFNCGSRAIDQATAKLGFCYLNGVGVSKDNGEAIRLYMVAANEGMSFMGVIAIIVIHSIVDAHINDVCRLPSGDE